MIRVGIIGGAGYTAGELIRLLVNHPQSKSYGFIATVMQDNRSHQYTPDLSEIQI